MRDLINVFKAHAAKMDAQQGVSQWGLVVAVSGSPFQVKVQMQPTGTVTSWLPVTTLAAGNGWGVMVVPQVGMQARIEPDAGSSSHWVVTGFAHSTQDPPPLVPNHIGTGGVPNTVTVQAAPGEGLLVGYAGCLLRLCADGSIYIRGNVGIDGNLTVNGDIVDQHGSSLETLRDDYDRHTHQYLPGPGSVTNTSVPNLQDAE